jgi:hypothetical protein
MNKRHFVALADVIRNYNLRNRKTNIYPFDNQQINLLADFCQSQNENFNRERWLAYIAGECGPNGGKVAH